MRGTSGASLALSLVAGASLATGGCVDAPAGALNVVVIDSAGVRIVETQPSEWPPPEVWQVADSPSVSIGVQEGDPDYELFQVRGAVGRTDGGVVVAEFGARLRYYDASGVHLRTLERRGEGPGEAGAFMEIRPFRGDSLLLTTQQMQGPRSLTQLLVLAGDGTYGRDIMAWHPGSGARSDSVAWLGVTGGGVQAALDDGSFIVEGASSLVLGESTDGVIAGRAALMRLDAEGELVDTVATVRTGWYDRRPTEPRGYELMLDEPDRIPVRAHGMRFYRASGESVLVDIFEAQPVEAGSPELGLSARLARSFRVDAPRQPTTTETRAAYIDAVVEIFTDEDSPRRPEYRERLESLRSPDFLTAVQDLRLDALGNIWLETYSPPGVMSRERARQSGIDVEGGPSRWIVLSPDGELLGSVFMPRGLEIFEIGADYVLGLVYDAFGVQYVRRHRIVK